MKDETYHIQGQMTFHYHGTRTPETALEHVRNRIHNDFVLMALFEDSLMSADGSLFTVDTTYRGYLDLEDELHDLTEIFSEHEFTITDGEFTQYGSDKRRKVTIIENMVTHHEL